MSEFSPLRLRRMLALRRFAIVADAELAELAVLAENVVEARFTAGSVIAEAGRRLPALHLVLDGTIESGGTTWGPQQVFGALEILAGREPAAPAIAKTDTVTLQLFASDVFEFLEDSLGVLRTTLRTLAKAVLVRHGVRHAKHDSHHITVDQLGLVERLLLLRQQPVFAGARLEALAMLAHLAEEVHWSTGDIVVRAGEPTETALVVVDGTLGALAAGDAVGSFEMLAEVRHETTLQATSAGRGLRCSAAAVYDVIEDHADFGLAMIATFASTLLDGSIGDVVA